MAFYLIIIVAVAILWFLLARLFGWAGGFVIDKVLKPFNEVDGNKREEDE